MAVMMDSEVLAKLRTDLREENTEEVRQQLIPTVLALVQVVIDSVKTTAATVPVTQGTQYLDAFQYDEEKEVHERCVDLLESRKL